MPNNLLVYPLGGAGGPPGPPGPATPEAATFVVSPIPGVGDFLTIEAAVAAAPAAGADIYVREGTYSPVGSIALPADRPIKIRGAGAVGIAQIVAPTGVPLFVVPPGSTVEYSFSGFKVIGDTSGGQALFSIGSAVNVYAQDVETDSVQSIVLTTSTPTVEFSNCDFSLFVFAWSFWNGSMIGGKLVWNYVNVQKSVVGGSPVAIVGQPEWVVDESYIGGAGFGVVDVGHVLWQGFRADFLDITIHGGDSKIDACEFQNVGITVAEEAFICSDSLFFGGGSGGFQLTISNNIVNGQNVICGCQFQGGVPLGIDLLADAKDTVISGCRFFPGYVFIALRTASTNLIAESNVGLKVLEVGAADSNRYSDILDGSTIIGPNSIVNDWGTKAVAVSTLLDETYRTVLVDATGGPVTITLPPAAAARYRKYTIKKQDVSANVVTIDADGAETIDGSLTVAIAAQYGSLTIQSDGTGWAIVVSDASAGAGIFAASRIVSLVPGEGTDLTIAAAIAALPVDGGDIYIKGGVYPIAASLDFGAKNVRIRGAGTKNVFSGATPTKLVPDPGVTVFKNGRDCSIEDIAVEGDNATSQRFYESDGVAQTIRCYRVNIQDVAGIIRGTTSGGPNMPDVEFTDCIISIPSGVTIPLADRFLWNGDSPNGELTFNYVELSISGSGATLMKSGIAGTAQGPTFRVVDSYVGGGGGGGSTNFYFAQRVVWTQFEIDNAQFQISGAFNTIVNCGFLDFSIKFLAVWNFISNSKFSQGGIGGGFFDAQVHFAGGFAGIPQECVVTGCLFYANFVANYGIKVENVNPVDISGCIFENHTLAGVRLTAGAVPNPSKASVTGCRFTEVTPVSEGDAANCVGVYDANSDFGGSVILGTLSIVDKVNLRNVAVDLTLDYNHRTVLVDATAAARTVTLPTAASAKYRQYTVKKVDASGNTVTVDAAGAETIDGALTVVLAAQWDWVTIQSDGTAWFIVA